VSRYNHNGLTAEEQAGQDRLQWEAHAATHRGRLEIVRQQIAALRAEEAELVRQAGPDAEAVDLGAALRCGPGESGVDLHAAGAGYDDPPF
jgi:hypothetical protein